MFFFRNATEWLYEHNHLAGALRRAPPPPSRSPSARRRAARRPHHFGQTTRPCVWAAVGGALRRREADRAAGVENGGQRGGRAFSAFARWRAGIRRGGAPWRPTTGHEGFVGPAPCPRGRRRRPTPGATANGALALSAGAHHRRWLMETTALRPRTTSFQGRLADAPDGTASPSGRTRPPCGIVAKRLAAPSANRRGEEANMVSMARFGRHGTTCGKAASRGCRIKRRGGVRWIERTAPGAAAPGDPPCGGRPGLAPRHIHAGDSAGRQADGPRLSTRRRDPGRARPFPERKPSPRSPMT